ncbi:MAG TPA: hypothetical protein VGP70_21525 [Actinomadura sp.]|nr:hypothetical protein [Actinomadura sp.]
MEKQTTVPLSAVARTAGEHRDEGAGDEIAVPTPGTCWRRAASRPAVGRAAGRHGVWRNCAPTG